MSLRKRRISRRALGVVVGASLLVLGLEAPAMAAPAVASFTPTSGPPGCVLVVTGTGFTASPAAQISVNFMSGSTIAATAATKTIISNTELWVTVPPTSATFTAGADYTIRVDDAILGTGTASTTTFLLTTSAGACAPTIASFTPTCGVAGDVVKITGTNLLRTGEVGGLVEFAPYTGTPPTNGLDASNTSPDISSPTTLQVVVPTGVADGPIQVTTFTTTGGRVLSTVPFDTPPPDCTAGPVEHARSVSLSLRKHLIAKGAVTVADDTAECMAGVTVKVQRRKKGGGWKNVASVTTTDAGKYKASIKDRPGKYRALAPKLTLEDGSVCLKDVSPRVRHTH